jgi:hypothetical protein
MTYFGGGPYVIGPGVVYGDIKVAPRSRAARARCPSRLRISFSSWINVQHVQQVARTQSDAMSPWIP